MSELVLSLFPGADLLGSAFEERGFVVVRGPDAIFGGDVRGMSLPAGRFDGIVGGPPCQVHSTASAIRGTTKVDLIPEFVRIALDARPRWIVMENVRAALGHPAIPREWSPTILRDWDCGGLTARRRVFWTWPFFLMAPSRRPGEPSKSVMATTWKRGKSSSRYVHDKGFLPGDLPVSEYARLQGADHIGAALETHGAGKRFAVTVLGNGVPLAMGRYVAAAVEQHLGASIRASEEG